MNRDAHEQHLRALPPSVAALTIVVPYNDAPAVERAFKEHAGLIACVTIEPNEKDDRIASLDVAKLQGTVGQEVLEILLEYIEACAAGSGTQTIVSSSKGSGAG